MAKIGFGYQVEEENLNNQGGGDFELMPDMHAVLEASAADLDIRGEDESDPDYVEIKLVFDIVEPEQFKGRKLWAYWPILDKIRGAENKRFSKFGKPNFDRLCAAIDLPGNPDDTDDLLFKQFVAKIGTNVGGDDGKGGKYKDKNEIKKFFFPSAPDSYPEIGVIEGGAKPTAANDNKPAARPTASRPAAAQAPAREPGSKPWAKKAAA